MFQQLLLQVLPHGCRLPQPWAQEAAYPRGSAAVAFAKETINLRILNRFSLRTSALLVESIPTA